MHLKHNKNEVIVYHVFDSKYEKNFKYENRPYRFIDLETGETIKVNPNAVRDSYLKKMQKMFSDLKLRSGMFGIDYVEADINQDFKYVLTQYLIKRKKMF